MRTHRVYPALQPWQWQTDLLRELVGTEHLVVARIEAVTRGREPAALIDLHFSDGDRAVTVPLVYVDLAQLDLRETDPLVFPHGLLGTVPDARASEIVELLLPELERRAFTGGFWSEDLLRFGPAPIFDRARERGFFGAAPLVVSLPRIAGSVYAQRFANAKHVVVHGDDAAECAAFLRGVAQSCVVIDGAGDDASAWYGTFPAGAADNVYDLVAGRGPAPIGANVDVRVDAGDHGGVLFTSAVPLPADIMIAFETADTALPAPFSVLARREPFTRVAAEIVVRTAAGGSAGRIALVVRPDAAAVPDADTGEAEALAHALRTDGFTPEILTGVDALDTFAPDLVHLFGVLPGAYARGIAEWAQTNRRPLVVHAFHESPSEGGFWGTTVAPYCFAYSADDRSVGTYLELLARRAVEVDGISPTAAFAPALAGLADAERVLGMADVVLVNSERERGAVERFRQNRPTFVVPPMPVLAAPPEAVAAQIGSDPFILVHAPIRPEENQLLLARAAMIVGAPMVFAGPVADPVYAERLREFAPATAYLLDEPGPGLRAGLYRAAAVVAGAAWISRGHGRLATASAMGAAIVRSNMTWLDMPDEGQWIVDPANVQSIARGIGGAWDAAVRADPAIRSAADKTRKRVESAAAAIVGAYAKIVQAV